MSSRGPIYPQSVSACITEVIWRVEPFNKSLHFNSVAVVCSKYLFASELDLLLSTMEQGLYWFID